MRAERIRSDGNISRDDLKNAKIKLIHAANYNIAYSTTGGTASLFGVHVFRVMQYIQHALRRWHEGEESQANIGA